MRLSTCTFGLMAAILVADAGRAEGVRLHGRANAALPATAPQSDEQSWGALTTLMVELPLVPQLGVGVEVGAVALTDGAPPENPDLVDARGASGLSGALSLHVRPTATHDPAQRRWHSGLWGGSSVGVVRSAGLLRLMGELNVGMDFPVGEGGFAAGPSLGLLHVFQPDDALRPEDANILSFGLHALFDMAPRAERGMAPAPPSDADGDGIADPDDACPTVAEDMDGYADADGCPDLDNDQDGVLDADDRCPLEAEDKDGFEDGDGCPDLDNDQDGVLDADDRCPLEAEDKDGFEDGDGCPDLDNDQDGIADTNDRCPDEAEVWNGYADDDGCPDSESVRVVGDKIELDERIHFQTNSTRIRLQSHPLLLRIGRLIMEHPEYVHIEVQGHADERGDEGFNQRLSDGRAAAVRQFLIEHCGIDPGRLTHAGYGSSQPLVHKSDPRSLYLNRRVEFSVTRATDRRLSPSPADTGKNEHSGGASATPEGER